ncbi:MAG: hypothetical protein RL199_1462 [Pseudomonadota bacterium]|jgi:hypothetical protein
MRSTRPTFLSALLTLACATTAVPGRDRDQVNLALAGQVRQLAQSVVVAPFFRDATRRLLLTQPPAEVELVVNPRGGRKAPGEALEVLPAGTRVRVVTVDYPTVWTALTRQLITPSERPWLELVVEERSPTPSYVFALRPNLRSADESFDEILRFVTPDDVAGEVARLPGPEQHAVRTRELATGLSMRAVELAWGRPNLRDVRGDGTDVVEDWTWRSDAGVRRVVHFRAGLSTGVETLSASSEAPIAPAPPGASATTK